MLDMPVIYSYTRAEAIKDGVLIDVSETSKEAGFRFPVALTSEAYADCVEWTQENGPYQDEAGRLWDVVFMAMMAIKSSKQGGSNLLFQLFRHPNRLPYTDTPPLVTLKLTCGPGDNGEPVITIMMPNED